MSKTLEYRTASPVTIETRDDGAERLTGYAAVFFREGVPETEFRPFEGHVERIAKGAFSAAIERGDDVRAVYDHGNLLLGRTKSGTLELSEDETGLKYSIDLPDTQGARDLRVSVKRGDLSGSSFKFIVDEQDFDSDGDDVVRTIRSVQLFDVGPVVFPAYEGTSVMARAIDPEDTETIEILRKQHELRQAQLKRQRRIEELTVKMESGKK